MKDPIERKYLDSRDVMERYRIGRTALHNWMKEEGFPKPSKIRRRNYFRLSELIRWEETQGVDHSEPAQTALGHDIVSPIIRSYGEFVQAMVARRAEIKMSCLEADAVAGMQEGYTNKLENHGRPAGRGMGPEAFPLWLGGMRVGIVLVAIPRRPNKPKQRVQLDEIETA